VKVRAWNGRYLSSMFDIPVRASSLPYSLVLATEGLSSEAIDTMCHSTQVLVTNQIMAKLTEDAVPLAGPADNASEAAAPSLQALAILPAVEGGAPQPTATVRTQTGGLGTAALGNTWSHSVNSRLLLEYAPVPPYRCLHIAKSPLVSGGSLAFAICAEGPVAVPFAVATAGTSTAAPSVPLRVSDPYEDDVAVGLYSDGGGGGGSAGGGLPASYGVLDAADEHAVQWSDSFLAAAVEMDAL